MKTECRNFFKKFSSEVGEKDSSTWGMRTPENLCKLEETGTCLIIDRRGPVERAKLMTQGKDM